MALCGVEDDEAAALRSARRSSLSSQLRMVIVTKAIAMMSRRKVELLKKTIKQETKAQRSFRRNNTIVMAVDDLFDVVLFDIPQRAYTCSLYLCRNSYIIGRLGGKTR